MLRAVPGAAVFLIAARDGDDQGWKKSKADLDRSLTEKKLKKRGLKERIATPAPTWSIETWLLALIGAGVDIKEDVPLKEEFERRHRDEKRVEFALTEAARSWRSRAAGVPAAPSLKDGHSELLRIEAVNKSPARPKRR